MRGRKPTPTALKRIKGTNQPCRSVKPEVETAIITKLPRPPIFFNALAKRLYKSKGAQLMAQNVLSHHDIDMFVSYCHEYSVYLETSEAIARIPFDAKLTESSAEVYRRIKQQNKEAWDRAKSIAVEFGFTPSARARVVKSILETPKPKDDFEDL